MACYIRCIDPASLESRAHLNENTLHIMRYIACYIAPKYSMLYHIAGMVCNMSYNTILARLT